MHVWEGDGSHMRLMKIRILAEAVNFVLEAGMVVRYVWLELGVWWARV